MDTRSFWEDSCTAGKTRDDVEAPGRSRLRNGCMTAELRQRFGQEALAVDIVKRRIIWVEEAIGVSVVQKISWEIALDIGGQDEGDNMLAVRR